jgi:Polyphosphate kinase 2 (PPK2)
VARAATTPPGDRGEPFWQERYEDINAFERHLDRNGTKIVKLFLHVPKEVRSQRQASPRVASVPAHPSTVMRASLRRSLRPCTLTMSMPDPPQL